MRLSFACTLLLLSASRTNAWSSMFDDNHLTPSRVGKNIDSDLPRTRPPNGDVPQGVDPNAVNDVPDYAFNVPRNQKHLPVQQQQGRRPEARPNPRQTNPPPQETEGEADVPVIFQLFKRKSANAIQGNVPVTKLPPVQPSEPDAQVVPNLSQAIIIDDSLPENLMRPAKLVKPSAKAVKPSDVVKPQVADIVDDSPIVDAVVIEPRRTTTTAPQEKYSVPMNPNAWFGNPAAGATVGVNKRDGTPDSIDVAPVQQDWATKDMSNDYMFPQNSQSINPYHHYQQQQQQQSNNAASQEQWRRRRTSNSEQHQQAAPPEHNDYAFPNAKAWFPSVEDQEKNRIDFEESIPNIVEGSYSSGGEHIVDAVVEPHTPFVSEVPLFPEIEDQEKNGLAFEASIPNIVEGASVPPSDAVDDFEPPPAADVFEYVVPGQAQIPIMEHDAVVVEDAVVVDPRPFASAPPDQPMFSNPVLEDEVVEDVVEDFLASPPPVAAEAPTTSSTMHSDDMLVAGTADDVTLDNIMVPAKVGSPVNEASIAAAAPGTALHDEPPANLHNADDMMARTPNADDAVPDNLMSPTKIDLEATLPAQAVANNEAPMNLPHEKDFLVAGTADDVVLDNIMPPTKMGADGSLAPTPPTVDEAAHSDDMLVAGTGDDVVLDNLMAPTKIAEDAFPPPATSQDESPNLPHEKDFLVAGTADGVVLDNLMAPTKIDASSTTTTTPPSVDEAAHADEMLVAGTAGDVALDNLMAPTKIAENAFPPSSDTTLAEQPNLPHEKDFLVAGTADDVVLDNIISPTKIDAASSTTTTPPLSVDEAAHADDMLVAGTAGNVALENLMAPTKMGRPHLGRKAAFVTPPPHHTPPQEESSMPESSSTATLNILEPTHHIGRQQQSVDPILTATNLLCLNNSAEFVEGPMQALALEDTLSQQWTLMQDRVSEITHLLGDGEDDYSTRRNLAHQDCLTMVDFTALVQLHLEQQSDDDEELRKMIAHERSICTSRIQVIEEALKVLFSNKEDDDDDVPPVFVMEETPQEVAPPVAAETTTASDLQHTTTEEDVDALMASINELLAEVEQEHQEVDALLSSSVHDIIQDKVNSNKQQEDGNDVMSSITSALNKGVGMASSYLGQFDESSDNDDDGASAASPDLKN